MKALNKTMVIAGGLALSGVIVASLAVAGNPGHHHKKHRLVNATSIDGNKDGVLTRDEVMAHSRMRFDRLDQDVAWISTATASLKEMSCRAG